MGVGLRVTRAETASGCDTNSSMSASHEETWNYNTKFNISTVFVLQSQLMGRTTVGVYGLSCPQFSTSHILRKDQKPPGTRLTALWELSM